MKNVSLYKRLPDDKIEKTKIELDNFMGRYRLHVTTGDVFLKKKDPRCDHPRLTKMKPTTSDWVTVEQPKKLEKVVTNLVNKMMDNGCVLSKKEISAPNPFNKKISTMKKLKLL